MEVPGEAHWFCPTWEPCVVINIPISGLKEVPPASSTLHKAFKVRRGFKRCHLDRRQRFGGGRCALAAY